MTTIDMTDDARPGVRKTRMWLSRRCECDQILLTNLLSHNGFGRLRRWREMAAPSVVCRAEELDRKLASCCGIDNGDG